MEAIILAGGLGTRLRSEVQDLPKSMAPIYHRPFLEYQLDYLLSQGVQRVVMSVGYLAEVIMEHFGTEYKGIPIAYAIEEQALGTGGAISYAMQHVESDHGVIVNGDSLFEIDLQAMMSAHLSREADATLALKPMSDFERYGVVDTDAEGRIIDFKEKQYTESGDINGGTYIFSKCIWDDTSLPEKFSLEEDFFSPFIKKKKLYGYVSDGYFLDIGIPEDYYRAQYEIGIFPQIDERWTLFLDRDGVLNQKRDHDYVKNLDELVLYDDALQAVAQWSEWVGRIVVVTNQQGIGKGLMTESDLESIHLHMQAEAQRAGARIDAIYHAPQLASENSEYRKPNIGMAKQAQADFPEIDFSKSILVGDSMSDIAFGHNAGMHPVYIHPSEVSTADYYSSASLSELTVCVAERRGTSL